MPTEKPRLSVMLEPQTYETLTRLARVQGRSAGAIIREVLEGVEAPLQRVAALLEAVEAQRESVDEAGKQALEEFHKDAAQAEADARKLLTGLLSQTDMFLEGISEDRGGDPAARGGAAHHSQPPYGNTGVRSGNGKGKRVTANPRKPRSQGGAQ
jgi:predicted DNA-binding protein